jgi:hypothetical protein
MAAKAPGCAFALVHGEPGAQRALAADIAALETVADARPLRNNDTYLPIRREGEEQKAGAGR